MSLFVELKRRNVFRATAAYMALGWVVTQVTSTVAPALHLPDWIVPVVVWIGVIGLPFVVVFSWVFELTPEGLKRERDIDRNASASITHYTARRLDHLAIGLFCVAIFLFVVDRFVPRESAPAAPSPTGGTVEADNKSIAVLPFADLSPGHDQEYFSDGVAEEILDALAQVPGLKVAGRTSSFYFKGKNETLQAIGTALGVAHVLEGSVRTQGNKVRITAQLIQTHDGFHLWSQSYDGDLGDVFQLQERIAHAITDQLKVVLQGGQKTQLAAKSTDNVEAHQQYLRGHYFLARRGMPSLRDAVNAFKAAIDADHDYADAWAGLAQTYALIPEYSVYDPAGDGRMVDTIAQALEAADHALRLDPASSRALSARGYVRCVHQFDWKNAEADYRAAIASDPRDSTARQWFGELFMYQRRWPEAAEQYDAGVAVDPLAPILQMSRALSLWYQGKLDAALAGLDESLRLQPDFYNSLLVRPMVLADSHHFEQALAAAGAVPEPLRETMLSLVAAMQDPARTDAAVQQINVHAPGGLTGKPVMLAMLGRNDLVLAELERLFAQHDPYREFLYAIPHFDPLHGDPRFQALLKQINLPLQAEEHPTSVSR
jgi:adenylate cyclase